MNVEVLGGPKDGQTVTLPDNANHVTVMRPVGPLNLTRRPCQGSIEVRTYDIPLCDRHNDRGPHIHWSDQ